MKNKIILIVFFAGFLIGLSVAIRCLLPENSDFFRQETAWWSERSAGAIFGNIGAAIGMLGALVGILGGFGKCLNLARIILAAMTGGGVISFIAGLLACAIRQPYAVCYPLLLIGVILLCVAPVNLWVFSKMRHAQELRKMESMDR